MALQPVFMGILFWISLMFANQELSEVRSPYVPIVAAMFFSLYVNDTIVYRKNITYCAPYSLRYNDWLSHTSNIAWKRESYLRPTPSVVQSKFCNIRNLDDCETVQNIRYDVKTYLRMSKHVEVDDDFFFEPFIHTISKKNLGNNKTKKIKKKMAAMPSVYYGWHPWYGYRVIEIDTWQERRIVEYRKETVNNLLALVASLFIVLKITRRL